MAVYSFNITASILTQSADIAARESTVFEITNNEPTDAYFTLETIYGDENIYTTASNKNTSGDFTLDSGLKELIKNDYIASVIVSPGGGSLTFVPTFAITGSTLRLRGIGG